MNPKVLIVDAMHLCIIDELESKGFKITYKPELDREGIMANLPGHNVLVIRSKTYVDDEVLDTASDLQLIARAGSGIDNIDEASTHKRGITVVNAPEGNMDAVGDHTVGLILALLNNIVKADAEVRKFEWDREGNRGYELSSMTVGIIGYGHTGSSVAKRLISFGCKIMAYDKYKSGFGSALVEEATMEKIFSETDILTFHVPLTDETDNLFNDVYLSNFEKPIYLINASRGPVVNLESVIAGLSENKILKAAFDVIENEKMNNLSDKQKHTLNTLFKDNRTIFTPHVGGWTFESYEKISKVLAQKIINFYN